MPGELLFKLAATDPYLLQVYLLEKIHAGYKSSNELFGFFRGKKNRFFDAKKRLDIIMSWDDALKNDRPTLTHYVVLSLFEHNKDLAPIYLKLIHNPLTSFFSMKELAFSCHVGLKKLKEYLAKLDELGVISIISIVGNSLHIEINDAHAQKLSGSQSGSLLITENKEVTPEISIVSSQINESPVKLEAFSNYKDYIKTSGSQSGSLLSEDNKGLMRDNSHERFPLDSKGVSNNRSYICNYRSLIDLNTTNTLDAQKEPLDDIESWIPKIISDSEKEKKSFFSEKRRLRYGEEGGFVSRGKIMFEDVMYVCDTWNKFAGGPDRIVSKFRIPKNFLERGYVSEGAHGNGEKTILAISQWISEVSDWREIWDEFLQVAESNRFIKGKHRYNTENRACQFRFSLSWLFSYSRDNNRELNLIRAYEGKYDFARDIPADDAAFVKPSNLEPGKIAVVWKEWKDVK